MRIKAQPKLIVSSLVEFTDDFCVTRDQNVEHYCDEALLSTLLENMREDKCMCITLGAPFYQVVGRESNLASPYLLKVLRGKIDNFWTVKGIPSYTTRFLNILMEKSARLSSPFGVFYARRYSNETTQ